MIGNAGKTVCPTCLAPIKGMEGITQSLDSTPILTAYSFVYDKKQQVYTLNEDIIIKDYNDYLKNPCSQGINFHRDYKETYCWFDRINKFKLLDMSIEEEEEASHNDLLPPGSLTKRHGTAKTEEI